MIIELQYASRRDGQQYACKWMGRNIHVVGKSINMAVEVIGSNMQAEGMGNDAQVPEICCNM